MISRAYSALAALAALLGYVATVSAGSYWLDGGEMVSATIALDILHPPGHPLTPLWGKLFTLLPLGALPFRVALGQAAAAALGVYFLAHAAQRALAPLGLPPAIRGALGALAACWVAFSFGLWFQAVRPEVYALQAAALMIAMERMSALAASEFRDLRALLGACLAIGLGLTNHHLMALFFFPPLALGAARVSLARRERGLGALLRPWLLCTAAGALCLVVYAYLPLRALAGPPLNLGAPTTLWRIYWVVSARVYARDMGESNPQPLAERYADAGVVLVEQLGASVVVLALAGVYAALRAPRLRAVGALWLLIAGPALLVRPWLGPVRGNPDSMAYLLAGYAGIAVLAALGVGAVLARVRAVQLEHPLARAAVLAGAALAAAAHAAAEAPRASLASFAATDPFDDARLRALPPRSVLVATAPQTVFRHVDVMATERVRPDVVLVPLPFLRYPGVADTLVARAPDVAKLVAGYLTKDALDQRMLVPLAERRPVLVELDTEHFGPETYAGLLPSGALFRTRDHAASVSWPDAVRQHRARSARLERALAGVRDEEADRLLLWQRYTEALYFAAHGARAEALRSLAAAKAVAPEDRHVLAFERALTESTTPGAFDVRPFRRLD